MMKSLLLAGAVTAAASANEIDLFATSSWDSSSYLMQQVGTGTPQPKAGLAALSMLV